MAIAGYGATGCTGRLVTVELTGGGVENVLHGRRREWLERLGRP